MKRTKRNSLIGNRREQRLAQEPFKLLNNSYFFYLKLAAQLQTADPRAIPTLIAGSIYFAVTQSTTVYLLLSSFLIAAAIKVAVDSFPALGFKIKSWHLLGLTLAMTTVLAWETPASAQFFDALEQAVTDVVAEGDTGIDEGIITTIFTFFRVIIILAFLTGVAVVLTQAFRGNDWGPIANMLGVGIAFVIVVELITTLMLGSGG